MLIIYITRRSGKCLEQVLLFCEIEHMCLAMCQPISSILIMPYVFWLGFTGFTSVPPAIAENLPSQPGWLVLSSVAGHWMFPVTKKVACHMFVTNCVHSILLFHDFAGCYIINLLYCNIYIVLYIVLYIISYIVYVCIKSICTEIITASPNVATPPTEGLAKGCGATGLQRENPWFPCSQCLTLMAIIAGRPRQRKGRWQRCTRVELQLGSNTYGIKNGVFPPVGSCWCVSWVFRFFPGVPLPTYPWLWLGIESWALLLERSLMLSCPVTQLSL